MKLSIVIPARNEHDNITPTLDGLRAHLDKVGISNFEILVVDDGSSDGTGDVVSAVTVIDPRVRVILQRWTAWLRKRCNVWAVLLHRRRGDRVYGRCF